MGGPSKSSSKRAIEHITVYLHEGQALELDSLLLRIRRESALKISRSDLVRMLVEALLASKLDVSQFSSREELALLLVKKLSR